MPARDTSQPLRGRLPEVALAACAGASELLAVLTHGGAFAGIVTGNVVLVGAEGVTGEALDMLAPATAVGGFVIGVAVWHAVWRSRPQAVPSLLAAELVLLLGYAVAWLATTGQPSTLVGTAMLLVVATAMGAQSVASVRMRTYTTYLTGALTAAVQDLVARAPQRRITGLRQIGALVAGAAATAFALQHLHWSAPLLPSLLLAVAVVGLVRRAG